MKTLRDLIKAKRSRLRVGLIFSLVAAIVAGVAYADIPGRKTPAGTSVPLPGTQQQDLANITFPAPYNVIEFPQTCGACHGGGVAPQMGHYGVWSGSVMASTARNPVFRADVVVVNEKVKAAGLGDGAANACWRCHVQNAFLSGRAEPEWGGRREGRRLHPADHALHGQRRHPVRILPQSRRRGHAEPDCGRAERRPGVQMLYGIKDWPHIGDRFPIKGDIRSGPLGAGEPYTEATSGPPDGAVIGMATYQIHDGMTYGGKYPGVAKVHCSDVPILGPYTGQTYGVFPGTTTPALNPDGS